VDLAPPAWFFRKAVNRGAVAGALPQRRLEIDRPVVLAQKIFEGFLGKLLEIHHPVARQEIERRPCRVIELDSLARNYWAPSVSADVRLTIRLT
jgi:hypothetical protein